MGVLGEVWTWFSDPTNWSGSFGIPARLLEHAQMSFIATALGGVVALPVGLYIGHTRRFEFAAVSLANLGRALPSFAILAFLFAFDRYFPGIGFYPTLVALLLLAIPPILTNTYVGVKGVDADTVEAARGMGLTERDVLLGIELRLAAPLIVAGFRTAAVQVVATATLAALGGWGGLGRFIIDGMAIGSLGTGQLVGGAVLVAAMAIVSELLFSIVERVVAPKGVARRARSAARAGRASRPAEVSV